MVTLVDFFPLFPYSLLQHRHDHAHHVQTVCEADFLGLHTVVDLDRVTIVSLEPLHERKEAVGIVVGSQHIGKPK